MINTMPNFKLFKSIYHIGVKFSTLNQFCLKPIGLLQEIENSPYKPGQLFIHKIFGYKGVILKMWEGKLYDKELISKISNDCCSVNYYQNLVDSNDTKFSDYVKVGLTFLPEDRRIGNSIYIIPNMDYVSQKDIIPFSSQDTQPIVNDYFNKFLIHSPEQEPNFVPSEKLTKWLSINKSCLEITSIQREITDDVRVTVIPFYLGSMHENIKDNITRYWRYIVRIENIGDCKVILRKRTLKIFSVSGRLETINGKGVAGIQPILSKENSIFQYHSHVQLKSSWGHMWGSFTFERENGRFFTVKIPSFPLCSNAVMKLNDTDEHV